MPYRGSAVEATRPHLGNSATEERSHEHGDQRSLLLPWRRWRLLQPARPVRQDKPYDGMTLNLASQNDQFAAVMADLAPQFTEETGITVKVDILSYPELLTKVTSDFIGDTKGYDIATMDIVWAGQFAESGWTVDLTDWIKRDAAEINVDDIYPVLMQALGNYNGKQVAFPFAGYANVLAYRTDLYEAAGLEAAADHGGAGRQRA